MAWRCSFGISKETPCSCSRSRGAIGIVSIGFDNYSRMRSLVLLHVLGPGLEHPRCKTVDLRPLCPEVRS